MTPLRALALLYASSAWGFLLGPEVTRYSFALVLGVLGLACLWLQIQSDRALRSP